MVKLKPSKLKTGIRFPIPAPNNKLVGDFMIYKTRAALLIAAGESIIMQNKAGIEQAKCKFDNDTVSCYCSDLHFDRLEKDYEFPVAVVENKPVFKNDRLYYRGKDDGGFTVLSAEESGWLRFSGGYRLNINDLSWLAKPKTVMVELLEEDAKYWTSYDYEHKLITGKPSKYQVASIRFYDAVRKALGK
jgi:hypothetical protein